MSRRVRRTAVLDRDLRRVLDPDAVVEAVHVAVLDGHAGSPNDLNPGGTCSGNGVTTTVERHAVDGDDDIAHVILHELRGLRDHLRSECVGARGRGSHTGHHADESDHNSESPRVSQYVHLAPPSAVIGCCTRPVSSVVVHPIKIRHWS